MARFTLTTAHHPLNSDRYGPEKEIPGYSTSLAKARMKAIAFITNNHRLNHVWVYKDGECVGKVLETGHRITDFVYSEYTGKMHDYALNMDGSVRKKYD